MGICGSTRTVSTKPSLDKKPNSSNPKGHKKESINSLDDLDEALSMEEGAIEYIENNDKFEDQVKPGNNYSDNYDAFKKLGSLADSRVEVNQVITFYS